MEERAGEYDSRNSSIACWFCFPSNRNSTKNTKCRWNFVGHPLLDELGAHLFDEKDRAFRRAKFGIYEGDTLLALMPGSRRSELQHHLQEQIRAARLLRQRFPDLKVALFVAPTFEMHEIQARLGDLDFPIQLIKDEPFSMISLADVVLCASGTATLMVGLMEKPMVIMYRMNPMTAFFAKRFVKHTAHFGMINLILNDRVVPELFQEQASAEQMAARLGEMIESSSLREKLKVRLATAKEKLDARVRRSGWRKH